MDDYKWESENKLKRFNDQQKQNPSQHFTEENYIDTEQQYHDYH